MNVSTKPFSIPPSRAVYQSVNGCVHPRFRNVTVTFTSPEFAAFAQLIGEAYVRLGVGAAVAAAGPH